MTQNQEGFFAEAHVKLRPVDFTTDGVFVCVLAHAPKSIDESITQAQAAAARAVSLLSEKIRYVSGAVAHINRSIAVVTVFVSPSVHISPGIKKKPASLKSNLFCAKGVVFVWLLAGRGLWI